MCRRRGDGNGPSANDNQLVPCVTADNVENNSGRLVKVEENNLLSEGAGAEVKFLESPAHDSLHKRFRHSPCR